MFKYAKIINEQSGLCEVGTGTNIDFYKSIGFIPLEVLQSDIDNQWYLTEKCPMKTDEEKAQEERERISMLYLTAADVERAIYKAKGMDFNDIIAIIEAQPVAEGEEPAIDIKALKIELNANNFYRGNPYIDAVGNLLGFSAEQLDKFFETGDYNELITKEPEPEPEVEKQQESEV